MLSRRVVVTGGTGFVGKYVCQELLDEGFTPVVLSRNPHALAHKPLREKGIQLIKWDAATNANGWHEVIDGAFAVIHMAGKGIFEQRWTEEFKKEIDETRVASTKALVDAMRAASTPPACFVSTSAVGYYGDCGTKEKVGEDAEAAGGDDFLSQVCINWEREAHEAENIGDGAINTYIMRMGIVVGPGAGVVANMQTAFQMRAGGHFGDGSQWMSWVHVHDVARGMVYPVTRLGRELSGTADKSRLSPGAYNLVSPAPVTSAKFSEAFGEVLNRWSWFHLPGPVVRLVLGEGANAILSGQHVSADKLCEAGFEFEHCDVTRALKQALT